jgi:hypothetical protein
MTTWTDAEGSVWELQEGKQNFDEWVVSKFADEFTVASTKWNAGDKTDMESLFSAWANTTDAVNQTRIARNEAEAAAARVAAGGRA